MGGRRGEISMMYDVIISLLLVGLFSIASISFIIRNANGDEYLSKFYSADIATSAEVVNAGYGDVVLRYDNIRPDRELRFWMENGKVTVGTVRAEFSQGGINYYGQAESAKLHDLTSPSYLILKKIENTFTVQEADAILASCPASAPKVPLNQAKITLTATTAAADAFKEVLKETPVQYGPAGNIIMTLQRGAGTENTITFSQTDLQGSVYSCHLLQQLERVSPTKFRPIGPTVSGNDFTITITFTLTGSETLTDEQMGRAAALALAGYYR